MDHVRVAVIVALLVQVPTATAGPMRDLLKGDDDTRAAAALSILRDADEHARTVVRRALVVSTDVPRAAHLPHIKNILQSRELDDLTRQTAALTLGVIGRDHPRLWPPGESDPAVHQPLPVFAKKALERCLARPERVAVRRACAEALGVARVQDSLPLLGPIIDDPAEDPALRIFAGRAATRMTGTISVSRASLDALVDQVVTITAEP